MNATPYRNGGGWGARVAIAIALVLVGAVAATWALARYQPAARFLGVLPAGAASQPQPQPQHFVTAPPAAPAAAVAPAVPPSADHAIIASLQQRLARVESATQQAQGSAGRADALVVTFAARRAIDRGVGLGYLEPLLASRFGPEHQQAVATVITFARQPVRLNDLITEYTALGPQLRAGGPGDSWWTDVKRQIGTLIEVHRANRPPTSADARYSRALQQLSGGDVDMALAETMRLPGAAAAAGWIGRARRYVAAHRALDELESAALMSGAAPQG